MAISWVLRHPEVTSALIGASRPAQIDDALAALDKRTFSPDELDRIEQALAREVGLEIPVLVRSRDELARVVARNPLGDVADDLKRYLVIFLSDKADRKLVAGVEAAAYEPERFAVHGREVYVWLPAGVHGGRLTQNFWERRLRVTATMRNWNTVEKLLALADS
jgi:uncharacterized protein (DUF1697 family)